MLYNVVLVSATHQHESAIGIHAFLCLRLGLSDTVFSDKLQFMNLEILTLVKSDFPQMHGIQERGKKKKQKPNNLTGTEPTLGFSLRHVICSHFIRTIENTDDLGHLQFFSWSSVI